jgi:peptide/nickel transport system permease protein
MWRRPHFLVGLGIVTTIAVIGIFVPLVVPHDPFRSSPNVLTGHTATNWFGTDDLGRDIFSRVVLGARTSLVIGIGGASLSVLIGAPVGLLAGYFAERVGFLLDPLIDLFLAMPVLVLALIITAMVGATFENIVLVLGFVMWPITARLVRGQAQALRDLPFVEAARAAGGSASWILRKHVWPNLMHVVAAQFAIMVSFCIFTSASLSFLGLGIPPPTPDWGGMVRQGFDYLSINPLMSLAPGVAVTMTAIGFYLVGLTTE